MKIIFLEMGYGGLDGDCIKTRTTKSQSVLRHSKAFRHHTVDGIHTLPRVTVTMIEYQNTISIEFSTKSLYRLMQS